jgi:mono/diheme cytochrome c family protein
MTKTTVRLVVAAGLVVLGSWLAGVGTASATMPFQKKAKELGFPAQNCQYCHVEKLPKKGASTNNERGAWLASEKTKRGAKEIDVAWLKDYKEEKK